MPFGLKVVEGQDHDFDEAWRKLLQPAVPEGWEHKRIDEVSTPGTINEQFKYYLRTADVVVFDLTAANPNVLYELGIRDVFAPGRRVLVAREGTVLPFNVSQERVIFYPADLAKALEAQFPLKVRAQIFDAAGSAIVGLGAAPTESRLAAQLRHATNLPSLVALWEKWKMYTAFPIDPLLELAKIFSEQHRPELALQVAERAYKEEPNHWEVARILGWYLRRTGETTKGVKSSFDSFNSISHSCSIYPRYLNVITMPKGRFQRNFKTKTWSEYGDGKVMTAKLRNVPTTRSAKAGFL